MTMWLKRVASRLPTRLQQELKRLHFRRQIRRGQFRTDEEEYRRLDQWVAQGDWVLDIGANVGQYTARLSELVGPQGRVIAFEPVPLTFELLAANVAALGRHNVTLLNAAASDATATVGMSVPSFDTGLQNFYEARVTGDETGVRVITLAVDALQLPRRIGLAKIDVEGHELSVVKGMRHLLETDGPVLIVEGHSPQVAGYLESLGYAYSDFEGSSNRVFAAAG